MRIIFFGSDDFANTHLEALIASPHDVVACVTQPDRARGRGMKVTQSPIKKTTGRNKIPLLQPESLKDPAIQDQLQAYAADVFIVVAYGLFLPKGVLAMPTQCCLNVHGSLLPKYRGAAPISWAIINGESATGVTVIKMNEAMDAGDMLIKAEMPITDSITAGALREEMAHVGGQTLLTGLAQLENGTAVWEKQDLAQVTYAPKLTKELGRINWQDSAERNNNLIRGLQPWPGCFTGYKGKMLKILKAQTVDSPSGDGTPGQIAEVDKESFTIICGQGALKVTAVHLENSRPMDSRSFLAGQGLSPGFQFV